MSRKYRLQAMPPGMLQVSPKADSQGKPPQAEPQKHTTTTNLAVVDCGVVLVAGWSS